MIKDEDTVEMPSLYDENSIVNEYLMQAVVVPLCGWNTEDLVKLSSEIDAELQARADEDAVY